MQTVLLEMPETIYQQFQVMAHLTHQRLEEVMMQTIQGNLPPAHHCHNGEFVTCAKP